jgi:hypothetical protein
MQEQWKSIEEASNYEVSNLGNIRNKTTLQVLKGRITKSGYYQVLIKINKINKFNNRYIHRLVAQYWIDNPENKREVNHKDGNKLNNNIDNLEWITSSDNQKHRHSIGITRTSQRRIGKFTKDGQLVAKFNSIKEAADLDNNGIRVSIDNVLQGKRYTLKGFVWKYLD